MTDQSTRETEVEYCDCAACQVLKEINKVTMMRHAEMVRTGRRRVNPRRPWPRQIKGKCQSDAELARLMARTKSVWGREG